MARCSPPRCSRRSSRTSCSGLIRIVAALGLTPLFFCLGYALQRFVIGPAAHGEDRNILLVTLGLAVVIENALLYAFRADTRTVNLPYGFNVVEVGPAFLSVPRVIGFCVVIAVALALWLLMRFTDTGKAIRAVAKEKLGAELSGIDVAHIYAVTFGLGTACLAIAACLLLPTYYVNPHAGNAFVLVAFTIVVLGGMGSVAGALDRRADHRRGRKPLRPLSRRIARPDRHLRHLHPGAAVPPERPVRRARMKSYAHHRRSSSRCSPACRSSPSSNVVLNFMVVALLIALVGQGWNVLGGYGGQYSFGHAAFFGTGAYATGDPASALRRERLGRARHRHRGRHAGRRRHRRAQLPLRPARLVLRAGHARVRRGAAHHRERRADHRRGRRHAGQARPALGGVPVPEPRAVLLDHPRLRRGLAR